MNYSDLIGEVTTAGSIKYLANWARLDSEGILDEAEKFIYSKLRVREMQVKESLAIALDDIDVAAPARFLDPVRLGIPGVINRIRYWDVDRFESQAIGYDQDGIKPVGTPSVYTIIGTDLHFNTKSDDAYTASFVFFKRPESLSLSNETNWLTDKYPTLVRRACMMFAYEERKEKEERAFAETSALAMIDDIKVEGDLAMRGMSMDFNWTSDDDD